jgi:hypothetical protein
MKEYTIQELLDLDVAFMGSDWQEDANAKPNSPVKGHTYKGEIPCILCNDAFYWACADDERITEETLPQFNKAVEECKGDLNLGSMLYCARIRRMRVQGAAYSCIPKELWPLFDSVGPEREIDAGNSWKPGEYKPCK